VGSEICIFTHLITLIYSVILSIEIALVKFDSSQIRRPNGRLWRYIEILVELFYYLSTQALHEEAPNKRPKDGKHRGYVQFHEGRGHQDS
jgi:hypothetical protein